MSNAITASTSNMKPIFIELLEKVSSTLTVLAAQDIKPLSEGMQPEAMLLLGKDLYEKTARMMAMLKESNAQLSHSLQVLRDLEIARHPDVEMMAAHIWEIAAAQRTKNSKDAFNAAEEFVTLKNTRRTAGF